MEASIADPGIDYNLHLSLLGAGLICSSVGGESLPLDSTALLIAGMSANLSLIVPIAAGIAGVGAFYIRSRMN